MSFLNHLQWRYATTRFDGKELPAAIIDQILEAIRMAPSSFGLQPFHVTVIASGGLKEKLKPKAWGQEQITSCSHLLVFSADMDVIHRVDEYIKIAASVHRDDVTSDPDYDYAAEFKKFIGGTASGWSAKQAYIALGFAMAACMELDVDSCPIEGFEPQAFKEILNLPKNLEPVVLLAIGYRSPDDDHQRLPKIRFSRSELFDER